MIYEPDSLIFIPVSAYSTFSFVLNRMGQLQLHKLNVLKLCK